MRALVSNLRWRIIRAIGGPTPEDFTALAIKAHAWDEIRPALDRAAYLCLSASGSACSATAAVHGVCDMVEATFRFAHRFDDSGRCSCGEWRQ